MNRWLRRILVVLVFASTLWMIFNVVVTGRSHSLPQTRKINTDNWLHTSISPSSWTKLAEGEQEIDADGQLYSIRDQNDASFFSASSDLSFPSEPSSRDSRSAADSAGSLRNSLSSSDGSPSVVHDGGGGGDGMLPVNIVPLIGDEKSCRRDNGCTMCRDFSLSNGNEHVTPDISSYLEHHVLFGIITGSFEQFFRMDVGYCTWMAHLPMSNVFVFTDRANLSAGRPGTWLEPLLPSTVKFSKAQLKAKGYTIHWIRAQYRFIQALQILGSKALAGTPVKDVHWVVVVDDDTFVDVRAMARLLHSYDVRNARGLLQQQNGSGMPLSGDVVGRSNVSDASQLRIITDNRRSLRMTYLGDKGWGGAGHFLNFAAATHFAEKSDHCVEHYMVRRFLASDETLKRCLPKIGSIQIVNDRLLSHCQAQFLRKRLLRGDHVSCHAKRDFVLPRKFAIWRLRLYYQVVYHRNVTAYKLLEKVGACAFGYSCKIKSCDAQHDKEALDFYLRLSGNDSFVPLV